MDHSVQDQRDMKRHHEKCKHHLYQFVQVELDDGSVYQGILHSYDKEKLYIIMPKMHHHMEEESSSRLFPFFGPFGLYGFPFFGVRAFGPFFPFFI